MLFLYFLFWTSMHKIYSHSVLTGKCVIQNWKDLRNSSPWTFWKHKNRSKRQIKMMIQMAWVCRFRSEFAIIIMTSNVGLWTQKYAGYPLPSIHGITRQFQEDTKRRCDAGLRSHTIGQYWEPALYQWFMFICFGAKPKGSNCLH